MRKLLTIAFDFPPRRTSGVYRPTGMLRHLARLGWTPTVVTVKAGPGDVEDPTLLAKIPPQVTIVPTGYFDLAGLEEPAAKGLQTSGLLQQAGQPPKQSAASRALRRVAKTVRSFIYFPDAFVGWLPYAFSKAFELHSRFRFEVMYTTSPPRTPLAVGLILKVATRIPWVAEFRDPWYPAESSVRQAFDDWLLGFILRCADAVVVTTEGFKRQLEERFPCFAKKVVVIRNGYDEEDFERMPRACEEVFPSGFFQLTHLGTIYNGHSGRFFPALAELVEEAPELKRNLRVNIVGFPDPAVRASAHHPTLAGMVELKGFVPHDEALQVMAASDCLLIFLGHRDFSRLAVSGKLFEYLRIGRPILALAYDGDLKRLIEAAGVGWVVEPEDTAAIKRALKAVLQDGKRSGGAVRASGDFVAQFRYDRLAGRLSEVLNSVTSHGS